MHKKPPNIAEILSQLYNGEEEFPILIFIKNVRMIYKKGAENG
jgi:hypothetical protein